MSSGSSVAEPRPQTIKNVRPFGWRDKIGYGFGDMANDMTFMIQAFFLMAYFTKVVGIDPLHIGGLIAAVRVLDAFTDIGVGRLIDTIPPAKDGKFKPWIRRMALPVAITSALLFQPFIADWTYGAKLAWMVVFYLLWGSVFYTAVNIPYGSMASVISDKAEERAELSVWRSTGAQVAFLGVSTLLPILAFSGSEILPERFGLAAIVMAVLAVIFYAVLYFNVEERVVAPPKSKEEKLGFGALMASLLSNRALQAIVVAALLLLLGNLFNGTVASFLFLDYFGNGQLQGTVSLVAGVLPFVLIVTVKPLVRRFGKTELGIFGVGLYVAAMLVNYFLKTENIYVFAALYTAAMFGLAIFNYLIWAFIVDVIDYQEVRSGQRDDATVYGMYSWARKLGQAASIGLGGIALNAVGYVTDRDKLAAQGGVQTPETIDGIWMLFNLVPALFLLGTLLCLIFWYPLKKDAVKENERILAERRAAANTAVDTP